MPGLKTYPETPTAALCGRLDAALPEVLGSAIKAYPETATAVPRGRRIQERYTVRKSTPKVEIVFAGGGTAGHLFPGLAVAEELRHLDSSLHVRFVGTNKPWERQAVENSGFDYLSLPCRPWPKRLAALPSFLGTNVAGYYRARQLLRGGRVAAVVGLGGYARRRWRWPPAHCAVPLVLLEQNAIAGRATRWLAPRARHVCLAMDCARRSFPAHFPVQVTGNPIRARFAPSGPSAQHRGAGLQLVVLGGSFGAASLNRAIPHALSRIRSSLEGWRIVHQAGHADVDATRRLYRLHGLQAEVVSFVDDMPGLLANTDLAICRAGGTTLAELAVARVPALLVPYPLAADDHQRANAQVFVSSGACAMVDERSASVPLEVALAGSLLDLIQEPSRRTRMAKAMTRLARPNAAKEVAALLHGLAAPAPPTQRPAVHAPPPAAASAVSC